MVHHRIVPPPRHRATAPPLPLQLSTFYPHHVLVSNGRVRTSSVRNWGWFGSHFQCTWIPNIRRTFQTCSYFRTMYCFRPVLSDIHMQKSRINLIQTKIESAQVWEADIAMLPSLLLSRSWAAWLHCCPATFDNIARSLGLKCGKFRHSLSRDLRWVRQILYYLLRELILRE